MIYLTGMRPSKRLDGKVIWITGASSGIGEALAYALRARGARLVLSARRLDRLNDVRERCGGEGVSLLPFDVASGEPAAPIVRAAAAAFGSIDVLVNNAGVSQRSRAVETDPAVVRSIMSTNFFGPVWLSTELVRYWRERRSAGQIVVVTSAVGKLATPLRSAYSASKHAAHGYFNALRAEVARDGIGVLLVVPGYVRTEISFAALNGDGTRHGVLDPGQARGIRPADAAERIARAIESGKKEISVGLDVRTSVALALAWLAPPLLRKALERARVT